MGQTVKVKQEVHERRDKDEVTGGTQGRYRNS